MSTQQRQGYGAFVAVPNPPNRPLKFSDADTLEACIESYFLDCERRGKPPVQAGLALWLGFCNRQSLIDYEHRSLNYTYAIKMARTRIEIDRQERLNTQPNVAGVIFDLKNNHAYRDQIDVTGNDGVPLAPPALNITLVTDK